MPAAAVRRKGLVLHILTRRKEFVGGFSSYLLNVNFYRTINTVNLIVFLNKIFYLKEKLK